MKTKNEIPEVLKTLKPGDKVYTEVKHVSQSGMTRDIAVYIVRDGEILNITWAVAALLGEKVKNHGVRVGGCGMDMGYHIVYSMGRYLFPDGFEIPEGQYGRNGDTSGFDKDGGYALKQSWL